MDNFSAIVAHSNKENSISMNKMMKTILEAKDSIKEIGPIFTCALSPLEVIRQIEKLAMESSNIGSMPILGAFCGINLVPLDGLKDKLLMFTSRDTMEEFLKYVDSNKSLMFLSQEKAVEEAIKFYEFIGKIKSGEMREKNINGESL